MTTEEDNFYIIQIYGDIDASSSIKLDKTISNAIKNNYHKILVDFAGVDYISSAGLGVFVSYIQDFEDKDIKFTLFGLKSEVYDIFEISGLHQLLTITDTKEQAKQINS